MCLFLLLIGMDTITAPIWVPPESQNVVAMDTSNQLDSATGQ
jgi:hypothetical protein